MNRSKCSKLNYVSITTVFIQHQNVHLQNKLLLTNDIWNSKYNTFFSSSKTVLIFSSFLTNISLSRSSNENGTTSVVWCSSRGWNGIPMCGTGRTFTGTISTYSTFPYTDYSSFIIFCANHRINSICPSPLKNPLVLRFAVCHQVTKYKIHVVALLIHCVSIKWKLLMVWYPLLHQSSAPAMSDNFSNL